MITMVMLNFHRTVQAREIIARQRQYASIKRVIVWNNNPEISLKITGAEVINCDRDQGMYTRFAGAALADTDAVLIQDDDILIPEKTLDSLYEKWKREPGVIHGTHGRNITRGRYTSERVFGECDIALTRCMIVHRQICIETLRHQPHFADIPGKPPGNGEDIVVNAVAYVRTRRRNWAYDLPLQDLSEPNAISDWEGHFPHRNQISKRCQEVFSS